MSFLLLSAVIASGCGEGVDVRKRTDGAFDIEAKGASMARVIQCFSGVADFKAVVDPGFTMGDVITLSLSARSAAEAVRGLLDGQGLNYAFTTDARGSKVLMLMISGRAAKAPSPNPEPPPLIRSVPPSRPGLTRTPQPLPEPDLAPTPMASEPDPPRGQVQPAARPRGAAPNPAPAAEVPLYPEPRSLTPLTQSDARRPAPMRSGPGLRR